MGLGVGGAFLAGSPCLGSKQPTWVYCLGIRVEGFRFRLRGWVYYRGLKNYLYYFGGFLIRITPKPYSNC